MKDDFTFSQQPISYHRGVRLLRVILGECLVFRGTYFDPARLMELTTLVPKVTWHSLRVTLLNAAVHAGVEALPISMQANHANTDLVIKYTRDRRHVPLQMVGKLLGDLRQGWIPEAPAGVLADLDHFSEDEPDDSAPQFYVQQGLAKFRLIKHPKFHVTAKDDLSRLACNKLAISDCSPLGGSTVPDLSVICKSCKKRRSERWPVLIS